MKTHNIALASFVPHGKVSVMMENGELHMTGGSDRNAYAGIPGKFKLPFRVDITAKMDSPALTLRIGEGYINLNTGGMDNRRMMSVIGGETKPNLHRFDHRVALDEYFELSVIYGRKAMQLIINGEERYFNRKDIYMKSPMTDTDFPDGFGLSLACLKRTEVTVKSLTVTEYTEEPEFAALPKEDFIYAPTLTPTDHPALEGCIKDLSPELKACVRGMDKHLKELKFRRKIEGGYPESKITYFVPKVVSYQIKISHHLLAHRTTAMLGFYINHAGERDQFNVQFLSKLEEISPSLAGEIFYRMYELHCGSCRGNHSCAHYNLTEYNGRKKNNCQHIVQFKMIPADFDDVKKVIGVILDLRG
ncbi:MAG: hypothetical protein FWF05_06690 [Oscillospiraceae bacterium]|nr:hypothetical protein [Oscillospiraceae bacterium]